MKKFTLGIAAAFLVMVFFPVLVKSEAVIVSKAPANAVELAEANLLFTRLNEISAMDRSELSSSEKMELRKEVRTIKSQLKELGGGVYLSVGAIIIIILLLILLA